MKSKNYQVLYRVILIAVFLFGTAAPLIVGSFSIDKSESVVEKRVLNSIPPFPKTRAAVSNYPKEFERYYNDNFGFRDKLSHIYNKLKYALRDAPSKKVILGEEGWLYFNGEDDPIGDYRNINILSDEELSLYIELFLDKAEFLNSHGVIYILVVAPNKHTIYPEYIPSYFTKVSEKSAFDQFLEAIEGERSLKVIDLRDALLKNKDSAYPLYFKTDTHWNYTGTNIAQYEIARVLAELFPGRIRPILYQGQDFEIQTRRGGDLANLMGLADYFHEDFEIPIMEFCAQKIGNGPIKFQRTFTTICEKSSLRTLVFRDSFFTALQHFFSEYFAYATFMWKNAYMEDLELYMRYYEKPDVVIEEISERRFR